jgi:hypothetical protein
MRFSFLRTLTRFAAGALLAGCVIGSAHAGTATSITGLYTTGANTYTVSIPGPNNNPTYDSNWNITTGDAYVVTNNVPGPWVDNTGSAKWISYASNPNLNNATYSYTLTFNIAGNGNDGDAVNNITITMALAVDDDATILVNGTLTSLTASGWAKASTVVLNSNFKQGSNTITINVANSGNGATGLLVSSIGGVVPEVGTWIPVVGGLFAFILIRFRPRKSALPAAV